jgi:hypothetical protein
MLAVKFMEPFVLATVSLVLQIVILVLLCRQRRTKRKEEVSPARNHHAHRRCAPHHYDIADYDTFFRHRFYPLLFNEYFGRSLNHRHCSRRRGNFSRSSWRLDSHLLALTEVTTVLRSKKEANARHPNPVADSTIPRRSSIPEPLSHNSTFVIMQKIHSFQPTFSLILMSHNQVALSSQLQDCKKRQRTSNYFKCELFRELWLPLLFSAKPPRACL